MKLTNQAIYDYAIALNEAFNDSTQRLPIKVNFYLQKNKTALVTLAQDIENERMDIIRTYGKPSAQDETQYVIEKEDIPKVQKELNDLFSLEQDVTIYSIKLEAFDDDLSLTTGQMEAIMFMIV